MIPDVIDFEILSDYRIKMTLSNGLSGIFDAKPYLDKGIFAAGALPDDFHIGFLRQHIAEAVTDHLVVIN